MLAYHPGLVVSSAVSILAIHLIWRLAIYRHFFSPLRQIPSVRVDWRTALYRWIYREPQPDQILAWVEQTPRHDTHALVRYPGVFGVDRVLLLDKAALREVLITKAYDGFHKPPLNRQRLAMFGNGLLASDGEVHRAQKRKMLPAFAPRNIRALVPTFWAKACELTQLLQQHVRKSGQDAGADLELTPWTSRAALDVIGVAAWGKDFGALSNPRTEVVANYHRMFRGSPKANRQAKLVYAVGLVVPIATLKRLFPCEFFVNIANGSRAIRGAAFAAIADKKAGTTADRDILSHAISTEAFDDAELAEQMLNVLAAGHETSGLATTWACYLLAKNPTVQARLRSEVRSALPSPHSSDEVTAERLESLPYLRAVVQESLRVIPTAPVTRREAKVDTSISGYHIPTGTSIIALQKHFNTRPEEWGPDAREFRPERWLDPNEHAVDKTFTSFNLGPRSCIGEGFAKLELAALLAALVGCFDIKLTHPDLEPDLLFSITMKPVGLSFHLTDLEESAR